MPLPVADPDTLIVPVAMSVPFWAETSASYWVLAESEVVHCATIMVTFCASLPVEYVSVYSSSGDEDVQLALGDASVRAKFRTLSGMALSRVVESVGNADGEIVGVVGSADALVPPDDEAADVATV